MYTEALFNIEALAGRLDHLPVIEQQVLIRLLVEEKLSTEDLFVALAISEDDGSSILDVLGAMDFVKPSEFATHLARVTGSGIYSDIVDSDFYKFDPTTTRMMSPAVQARFMFCAVQKFDDAVVVLGVDPEDSDMHGALEETFPGHEVIFFVGTPSDVTHLIDLAFQDIASWEAVHKIEVMRPEESASRVFSAGQIVVFCALTLLFAYFATFNLYRTISVMMATLSLFYVLSILYKLLLALVGSFDEIETRISDAEVYALDDSELPIYSILVPVYKEPEVVSNLLGALSRLNYPRQKLDVLILMEADDLDTITAVRDADPPSFIRPIYVPPSHPRTKPKACNYGMLFCRGQYVTIYDAEDIPHPDQLKKAIIGFERADPPHAVVQAALNYYNSDENWLTRMFTLEYTYWFDYMLPGLDRLGLPIPLGGTSNHFQTKLLRELGAWDPYNVTEDADLGIRATARGFTVGVINSTTMEEANKAPKNWIRQRSRWIKGYMQTWLVHNRHPIKLLSRIGFINWLSYQFFIGGTVLTFLINPVMWIFTILWLVFGNAFTDLVFTRSTLHIMQLSFVIGNALAIYLNMLSVLRRELYHLTLWALFNPVYWVMHSLAAYMALWQLFTKPFYWEKTEHGLTTVKPAEFAGSHS